MLEWEGVWDARGLHLIERWRVEMLSGTHAEGVIDGKLVVLVEEVIGVDIVGGGNGGMHYSCGHSEKLVRGMLDEGRETRVDGVT